MSGTALIALALGLTLTAALAAAAVLVRRTQADLRIARDRAARAEQARDAFFDIATHELRSPLAAILGYQELLHDGAYGDLPDAAREPIFRIGRSGKHLLNLIDGVVELSRLRAGGLRAEREPVNLGVVLSGVTDSFRTHASDRGIEPRVDLPTSLPIITSDLDRLLRALDLLITSAVKHPAGDAMSFTARTTGDDLEIHIHPTSLAVQQDADEPALRLGIRLAVVGGVAQLLGGALELESDDDGAVVRGLRFTIRDLGHDASGRM